MIPFRRTEPHPRRRGTATTETILVLPLFLLFVVMTPWVAHLFLDVQVARTEAHRDTFAKTTTMLLMPEALMDNHVNAAMSSQFGAITSDSRQHALASPPPAIPDSINGILDPPEGLDISIGPFTLDLFPGGFPNSTVEGWEYIPRANAFGVEEDLHLMAYGAVIRSPWTRLGWPWVATQDIMWEPKLMQDWQGEQEKIDDDMRERYKLAE